MNRNAQQGAAPDPIPLPSIAAGELCYAHFHRKSSTPSKCKTQLVVGAVEDPFLSYFFAFVSGGGGGSSHPDLFHSSLSLPRICCCPIEKSAYRGSLLRYVLSIKAMEFMAVRVCTRIISHFSNPQRASIESSG